MSCPANCDTVQLIEPQNDLLVDTAGATSDIDERGELPLSAGQTSAAVAFLVTKLNTNYHFEYLYVDCPDDPHPGAVVLIPVTRAIDGFTVAFAGAPIGIGYVLRWRVTIASATSLVQVDAPEDQYLRLPRASTFAVTFLNPRSSTAYGFQELRVENVVDPIANQSIISVQVYSKTVNGFSIGLSPTPPSDNYFLRMRT